MRALTRFSLGRFITLLAALAVAAVLAASGGASAGTYVVFSCHTPSGGWASTEGWTPGVRTTYAGAARATQDCETNGATNPNGNLVAEVREPPPWRDYARAGDTASWSFAGPDGTVIQDVRAGICAAANAITGTRVSIGGANDWTAPGVAVVAPNGNARGTFGCGAWPWWRTDAAAGGRNYVDFTGLNVPRVWFAAWCVVEDCNPGHDPYASVQIATARFTLRDSRPPTVARASGNLAGGTAENGRFTATFDAADIGAGVYRAVTEIKVNQSGEWKPVGAEIVDRLGGRCAPAGVSGSPYEFLYPRPCRAAVAAASVSLDTAQLPVGDHLVRAVVEDAAGNRADIVPPRIVHIDGPTQTRPLGNVGPPAPNNGRGASARALVRLALDARTVGFHGRADVRGRLVDENERPIAEATIQVDTRRFVPRRGPRGAPWRPLGKVTTDAAGRFVARIPASMSRVLRFSYRANHAQEGFTSATQFTLRVRAHVRVRVLRARLRNGQAATFVGRVAGTPRGGVPLSLQAYVAGRGWTPARTERPSPRTGPRGRFRVAYRFARTFQRVVYRFRIVVGEDSAFPFVQTASRRMRVVVRP